MMVEGLTKRELLAGMAMQGMLAGDIAIPIQEGVPSDMKYGERLALLSFRYADALLAKTASAQRPTDAFAKAVERLAKAAEALIADVTEDPDCKTELEAALAELDKCGGRS